MKYKVITSNEGVPSTKQITTDMRMQFCVNADADPDSTTTTPPNSDLLTSPCETSYGDDENSCDLLLEEDNYHSESESVTGDDPL